MTVDVWSGSAYQESRVAGPHHFNADPDPALADTHPDLAFYFNEVRFRILIKVTTGL
jgi:hypothetical protein